MVERLEILPVAGPLRGTVQPPGSKSVTNRALICAALAEGESLLCGALDSEDTRVLVDSLGRLGLSVAFAPESSDIRIAGCGGTLRSAHADLYIANSGTSVRFLTALCTLGTGHYRLDGTARMRERPIRDLLDSLTQLGVSVRSESNTGCPPVVVEVGGTQALVGAGVGDHRALAVRADQHDAGAAGDGQNESTAEQSPHAWSPAFGWR